MARIGQETRRVINDTQELVIAAICDLKPTAPAVRNQVIEAVSQCAEDKVEAHLGSAGKTIRHYATSITLQHPEMGELSKQSDWDVFSRDVFQALAAGEASNDNPVELKNKVNSYKTILRAMSSPKPRFIGDPLKRSEAREAKSQIRHVNLKQVYMLGENGFYGKPDNFQMYVRNSKDYLQEMSKMEVQQKVFADRNMPEVSHAVKKRIKSLEEMKQEEHLGFHRIKPTDAAMISARMHGLKWHELHFLTVPFKFFESNYWPEVPEKREEERAKDEMKKLLVMKDRKMAFVDSIAFTYQPRLYPLAKFPGMPKQVGDIITAVEGFGELNGCPVFDYYWVLMPSVNINHPYFRHKDGWKVYARRQDAVGWTDLQLQSFTDEYNAALALDSTLACDGYFVPIVLGEREGKCFFLCLWR